MTRVFLKGDISHYTIEEVDLYHLEKVLRMRVGEEIEVVIGHRVFFASISSFRPFQIKILKEIKENRELPYEVTLLYCLAKGEKSDLVMQKAVELGVSRVIGVLSSRTVVRLDEKERMKKKERYAKIMKEASAQCKRTAIPEMGGIIDYKHIDQYVGEHNFIAYEEESIHGKLLKGPLVGPITILIGSEGGFSKEEVEFAMQKGFQPISLGKRILRSETAAIAALTTIGYILEGQV